MVLQFAVCSFQLGFQSPVVSYEIIQLEHELPVLLFQFQNILLEQLLGSYSAFLLQSVFALQNRLNSKCFTV